MLTTEDAIRILNILSDVGWPSNAKKGYEITGYEVNDDGPEAPEGERYWGDVFVNGYSAGVATMSDSKQQVYSDLALSAVRIAAGKEPLTIIEVVDGDRTVYASEEPMVGIIEVRGNPDGSPNAYRVLPKPLDELPEELKELAERSVGPQ